MSAAFEIEGALRRAVGLDVERVGRGRLEVAVRERCAALSIPEAGAYAGYLAGRPEEAVELAQRLVVGETWFFRDAGSFACLGRLVREGRIGGGGPVSILSLGCATGEEPYSIAISLLSAGLAPGRLRIEAVDLGRRAIERAREAVFGERSFRAGVPADLEIWFEPAGSDLRRVRPAARDAVRFRQANLLDLASSDPGAPYDLLFCRNLLLYFDEEARARAAQVLLRLLKPDGLVFVGAAELGALPAEAFHVADLAGRALRPGRPLRVPAAAAASPEPLPPAARSPRPAPPPAPADLEAAWRLADGGRLAEAARVCEDLLRSRPLSVDAHYLLALAREGLGRADEAERLLDRVLYLEPGHAEAARHLAGIVEARGDRERATILRRRARRHEAGDVR